jgi:hypothetical protein
MESLYHAYQNYERQVAMGMFCARRPRTRPRAFHSLDCLLADLGDLFIQAGNKLKRGCGTKQMVGGSPAVGKLNR